MKKSFFMAVVTITMATMLVACGNNNNNNGDDTAPTPSAPAETSVPINTPEPTNTPELTNTPEPTEAPTTITREQQALSLAKSCLEKVNPLCMNESLYVVYTPNTYTGLICFLEEEGFTKEEATYAADNCGANWKVQAIRYARVLLRESDSSYSDLLETLEYIGFTKEEAVYAAEQCGVDWTEQAVRHMEWRLSLGTPREQMRMYLERWGYTSEQSEYALGVLDTLSVDWKEQALKAVESTLATSASILSYEGLVGRLTTGMSGFEGFTEEEAIYAADNCGVDWKEQAAEWARNQRKQWVLQGREFSKEDLISGLERAGFTKEEVAYAVESIGYIPTPSEGEKEQALGFASIYLEFMTLSYEGLIGQLESYGFSKEVATYAADNCGKDWKEQAIRCMESVRSWFPSKENMRLYLQNQKFTSEQIEYALDDEVWNEAIMKVRAAKDFFNAVCSYSFFIDSLTNNGFSKEDATYVADHCGMDWKENAVTAAKAYMAYMALPREELILQLKYEGFTEEEATYAADNCGGNERE